MTAAAVLDYLATSGELLHVALATLPKYFLVKEKVHCPVDRRDRVLELVAADVASDGSRVLTLDGLKVFRDDGWMLLRPSGTEPLIRVFAEAKTRERAEFLANDGLDRVRSALQRAVPNPP
ncbi:MAG: hypothetical protein ACHQ16_06005 [Candidatus Lutacidiplasmatales archaeon]